MAGARYSIVISVIWCASASCAVWGLFFFFCRRASVAAHLRCRFSPVSGVATFMCPLAWCAVVCLCVCCVCAAMAAVLKRRSLGSPETTPLLDDDKASSRHDPKQLTHKGKAGDGRVAVTHSTLPPQPLHPTIPNFRDVASVASVMRAGFVYRSGTPAAAEHGVIHSLVEELGVRTVIDLRERSEAEMDTNISVVWSLFKETPGGAEVLHTRLEASSRILFRQPLAQRKAMARGIFWRMPLSRRLLLVGYGLLSIFFSSYRRKCKDLFMATMNELGLEGLNEIILQHSRQQLLQVLEVFATPTNYPVLLHCSHGKDRTGLVVALLLKMLGAPDDEVITDYAISDSYGQTEHAKAKFAVVPELDVARWSRAVPHTMEKTLEFIRFRFGSVEQYLDHIGFGPAKRDSLRAVLQATQ
eukprot:m.272696 g.272696  ORF g.272696 m.272696 type:complete len:414 (-) comp19333_c0_seq12:127-1368(-)